MGDEHIGDVGLLLETLQQLQDPGGDHLVQRRGYLVADDQIGFGRERPGDADTLLLAHPTTPPETDRCSLPFQLDHAPAGPRMRLCCFLAGHARNRKSSGRPRIFRHASGLRIQRDIRHLVDQLHLAKLVSRSTDRLPRSGG